jgi:hypothetical protein
LDRGETGGMLDTRSTVVGFFKGDGPFFTSIVSKRVLSADRGIEASTSRKGWVVAMWHNEIIVCD